MRPSPCSGSLRSILSLCTPSFKHSKQTLKQKKKILKKAFEEFYRVLDMLQSYVDLNRTGTYLLYGPLLPCQSIASSFLNIRWGLPTHVCYHHVWWLCDNFCTSGVRKIVKKYDKNMKEHLTDTLLPVEYRRYCFSSKKHAVLARSVSRVKHGALCKVGRCGVTRLAPWFLKRIACVTDCDQHNELPTHI